MNEAKTHNTYRRQTANVDPMHFLFNKIRWWFCPAQAYYHLGHRTIFMSMIWWCGKDIRHKSIRLTWDWKFLRLFFCPRLWSVPFGQPTSQQPACLCFLCVTLIYECSMLRRKEFTVYAINIHDLGLWSIILGMVRRVSIDNKKHSLPSCLLCRKNRNTFCRNIAFHCQCNGRNRRKWPK